MADWVTTFIGGLIGGLGNILRNGMGIAFIVVLGILIYLYYIKPKPVDYGKLIFQKQWDATKDHCPLDKPKKLLLCSLPISTEELNNSPIHQIPHIPIGDIVGINVFPVIHNIATLKNLCQKPTEQNIKKLLEENEQLVKDDNFWIVLGYQKKLGGSLLFSKVKKTLMFVKPYQIVNINNMDALNIIMIKGFGITSIGEYEIVNDEFANINRLQLLKDTHEIISEEITLSAWSSMGEIVKAAMQSDSGYRKAAAEKGFDIANSHTGQEAKI